MSETPDPIETIRARHRPCVCGTHCEDCDEARPCDTFVVLAALDEALADLSAVTETLDHAQGDLIAHRDCLAAAADIGEVRT